MNLRLTVRGLVRTPMFSLVAILSLALGIGANTAIFSLLDQILLRTLPVRNPDELVFLYHPGPLQGSVSTDERGGPSFSYPMFRELQRDQTPFVGLAGARMTEASLSYKNQASKGTAHLVSGNYFSLLGVRAAVGRPLTEDDDQTPGGHPVAVLSHGCWTTRFGADPAILNQTLIVNGYPLTVVGVTQKGFASERLGSSPEVFVPITMKKEMEPGWNAFENRRDYWVTLFGRLKPGGTREQAEAAVNVIYRAQLEQDAQLLGRASEDFLKRFRAKRIILKPGQHGRGGLREEGRRPLLLLMGMTLLVLLISCANVANLQLARGAARFREIAVRLALGATRMQLVRQLLTESCILALAGGALGLGAAYWTLRVIIAALPPETGMASFLSATLDSRVLLFCLFLSLATGIIFGLFPTLQSSKPNLVHSLNDQSGQTTSSRSANFFRKSLVTAQVAVSLLLLISAGLFAQTLLNLKRVDLGIQVDHLLTFSLMPRLNGYTDERAALFYNQLTDRLSGIPGVRLVSTALVPAIAGSISSTNVTAEGFVPQSDEAAHSNFNHVGSGYFRTMGIPLVAGREFTPADNFTSPKVAIVNEAFVRHFLPNQNPLGRRIFQGGGTNVKFDIEIVGVVKDAKYSGIQEAPPRVYYRPTRQFARQWGLHFYVRTAIDPQQIAPLVRREVAALDPNMPIRDFKTMQAQIDENIFAERLLSMLTANFAGLATLLAAVGLYGVLAYNVARRTREIGIRIALGAEPGHLRGLVIKEVVLMLAIGTAAGLSSAVAAGKMIQSMLFGLQSWDAFVYGSSALILWAVAVASAYMPVRRATRVDPVVALRYE